jgi:hypothetical protein
MYPKLIWKKSSFFILKKKNLLRFLNKETIKNNSRVKKKNPFFVVISKIITLRCARLRPPKSRVFIGIDPTRVTLIQKSTETL